MSTAGEAEPSGGPKGAAPRGMRDADAGLAERRRACKEAESEMAREAYR